MAGIERVLVGYDGTPLAMMALEHALVAYPEADVTVLYVIDYLEEAYAVEALLGSEELRNRAQDRASELLEEAEAIANEHGREISTTSHAGRPDRELIDEAEDRGVDTIVVGSHGRSLVAKAILGSVAESVVRRAPVPVVVVR